jgi:tetratricopeptide (TPR) repeat protein
MIPFLAVLLMFAETPKSSAPADAQRFANISKQAGEAREQERLDEAVRLYREAVRLRPEWKEGWWYLGTMFYDQDRYEEGRAALRRFTVLDAKVASAWAFLGLCEHQLKEYEQALVHLKRAIALGLDETSHLSTVTQYHAALLLTRSGQFEGALEVLGRLAQRSEDSPAMVEAAGIAGLRKPLLPIELPPSDRELVLQVGRAVWDTGARRMSQAQKEFENLAANYPKTPNIHYLFGSFLILSDPDAGLLELKKELEVSPQSVPALLQIAFEYLRRSDAATALPYARQAAEIEPESFVAHNALGRALAESGDLEGGIRELEMSKKQAPGSPQTRIALASAYAKVGRNEDAARERAEFLKLKQLAKKPGEQ